jgi:hypothetical protein
MDFCVPVSYGTQSGWNYEYVPLSVNHYVKLYYESNYQMKQEYLYFCN